MPERDSVVRLVDKKVAVVETKAATVEIEMRWQRVSWNSSGFLFWNLT